MMSPDETGERAKQRKGGYKRRGPARFVLNAGVTGCLPVVLFFWGGCQEVAASFPAGFRLIPKGAQWVLKG